MKLIGQSLDYSRAHAKLEKNTLLIKILFLFYTPLKIKQPKNIVFNLGPKFENVARWVLMAHLD